MRPAEARREVVRDPVGLSVALVDRLVVSDNVPDGLICMRILYLLLSRYYFCFAMTCFGIFILNKYFCITAYHL